MSSLPGFTLEAFLKWYLHTDTVETELLLIFEKYREPVEDMLLDFDEEKQSWRGFSQHVEERIPIEVWTQANNWMGKQLQVLRDKQRPLEPGLQTLLFDNLDNLRPDED
jgi:hypothetical protein